MNALPNYLHRITIVVFALGLMTGSVGAQPVDSVLSDFDVVALLDAAHSFAIDPAGTIYIVERARSRIRRMNLKGGAMSVLGGPGASEGQFDQPSDIDPTNGLVLVVADAGNSRIQRFSREFLFLESLVVGRYERAGIDSNPDQPRYRQEESVSPHGSGWPIAVKTTPNNDTYAIDAYNNLVVKWDQDRNIIQLIGEYNQGEGALSRPVALELGPNETLYVLDTGHASVLVYDAFGGYLRSIGEGLLDDATSLVHHLDRLFIVLQDRLVVMHEAGRLDVVVAVEGPGPLLDVAFHEGELFLLTASTLLKWDGAVASLLKLAE